MEDSAAQLPNMTGTAPAPEYNPMPVADASAAQTQGQQDGSQEGIPQQPYPENEELEPTSHAVSSGAILGVVIAIILFLCLGSLALIAASYGKGTLFSQAAAYIPVEQIPLLNALTKTDTDLLHDVVPTTANYVLNNTYGGSEWSSSVKITADGQMANQQYLNVNLTLAGKTAVNANNSQMQAEYTASGSVSSGVMKIDLGQDGAKYDVLMTDPNTMYFMLHLSDQLRQTVDPLLTSASNQLGSAAAGTTGATGATATNSSLTPSNLFDTYWKLDMKEYTALMNQEMGTSASPTTYDASKYQEATKKLLADIGPELQSLYTATLGNYSRYAKVDSLGRQTVNGKSAREVGLEITNDSLPPVIVEFADGMGKIVASHPASFMTFCQTIASDDATKQQCATTFGAANIQAMQMTDTGKTEIQTALSSMLKQVSFSNVHFYISPVDNTLLKTEFTIGPSADALSSMNANSTELKINSMQVSVSSEEVSRGKPVSVQPPAQYKDVVTVLKTALDAEKQLMLAPPAMGGGLTPGSNAAAAGQGTPDAANFNIGSTPAKTPPSVGGANVGNF
jgi:hypothetical protein